MPKTKTAQKALRQNKKRRLKNIAGKIKLRETVKKFRTLLIDKKSEEAKKGISGVYKILDKSAKTGLIKKNTASRKKARLTQALNKLGK